MIPLKITFPKTEENLLRAMESQSLTLLRPEHFRNLRTLCCDHGLLFDGYSMGFQGDTFPVAGRECFSVSVCFLPLTFSAHADSLVCCYDEILHRGFDLRLRKGGVVNLRFGGIELTSCNAHVQPGVKNIVTVVYRGDTGWCDLFVNGVFSNRRQFGRNTVLTLPEKWYLGKGNRDVPFGCFYGFMDWVSFEDRALDPAEVMILHRAHYSGAYDAAAMALGMPHRAAYKDDPHRPRYHLQPPGKWMNEPHGPMYYGGWYHIFYQGNPHAPIWDHLAWGHLYSRDMVRWLDAPLALTPEGGTVAPDGIWSGSSLVDREGKPRIYFTAGNDHAFPNQSVALATPVSEDGGRLLHWKQHPVPVQTQDIGWMGEFRDPFVWLEDDTYFMLVGTGNECFGGGNAALYSSADGITWESHGMLLDYDYEQNTEVGHVWELPVLLPLRDEAGNVACHILLLCACRIDNDIVENYYFLGNWDAKSRTFTRLHDRARLIDLGHGVFTGPSGFVTPDGRSVVFTIAQGKRGFRAEVAQGWAHNGGMPIELFWKNGDLAFRPIREIHSLKKALVTGYREYSGDMLCLEMSAEGDFASISACSGEKSLTVRYDRNRRRLEVLDEKGTHLERYRGEVDDVDIGNDPIRFECFLDHSMFEVWLNERKSVSLRNYFDGPRSLRADGAITDLRAWEMDAAYSEVTK